MKRMTSDEIRKVQLDMLSAFHTFCEENNLRYFLDAGSLLGAIRHNGFIPWDDDIDLGMPRIDYERAISLGEDGFGGHYKIMTAKEGAPGNAPPSEKRYGYRMPLKNKGS